VPRRITRTVWAARFSRRHITLLDRSFEDDLAASLDPSRVTVRYGRQWRVSQPQITSDFVSGKFGFVRRSAGSAIRFDEDREDFIVEDAPATQGNFVFYVVHLPSRVVAFEERLPDIRRQSFIGAMELLLREANAYWDLDSLSDEEDFEEWLAGIDLVTRFRATLKRPNPSPIRHARDVAELIEATNATSLVIEAGSAPEGAEGLEVTDTILGAAARHAGAGNGDFRVTGISGQSRRFFDSARRLFGRQLRLTDQTSEAEIVEQLRPIAVEAARVAGIESTQASDD